MTSPSTDFTVQYKAISGRDARFDGSFYTCVVTTGIYCLPSCPSRTPKPENCRFVTSPEAARAAGFRACKRCHPDALGATPTAPEPVAATEQAIAMIQAGFLDDADVPTLARTLHVSERHLQRLLAQAVGATAVQLASSGRVARAVSLLAANDLSIAEVAFAAGFASVRQFNEVMLAARGATPSAVRQSPAAGGATRLSMRLPCTAPYFHAGVLAHLVTHEVPGVASGSVASGRFSRTLRLGRGTALVHVDFGASGVDFIRVHAELADAADIGELVARVRRWLDADADPCQIARALQPDALLAPLVAANPGLRLVQAVDAHEAAMVAVVGQHVSLAAASTYAGRLAALAGESYAAGANAVGENVAGANIEPGAPYLVFPTAAAVSQLTVAELRSHVGLTSARSEALLTLASALADGSLDLSPSGESGAGLRAQLLALPGIGPWTADIIELRACGNPDAFAPGDLVVRRALGLAGVRVAAATREARERAEMWRPFRGYAMTHLWFMDATRS